MHITPAMVEKTYELLRVSPPFKAWRLPHVDALTISVTGHKSVFGAFHFDDEKPGRERLSVSAEKVKTLDLLVPTVAHEMVHLREYQISPKRAARADHGKVFRRLAAQVCHHHGWDLAKF